MCRHLVRKLSVPFFLGGGTNYIPDDEVHESPSHGNFVNEHLWGGTAQPCVRCILDRVKVRVLAYPERIFRKESVVDIAGTEPNA
jgi:hypothetical protein